MESIDIERAVYSEAPILTSLSIQAKKYWDYPEEWIQIWMDELIIDPKYIEEHAVYVAKSNGQILGFYAITIEEDGYYLDSLLIDIHCIGQGFGRMLSDHMKFFCIENNIKSVRIISDPNAKGFYEKIGAQFEFEITSQKIPKRTLPVYRLDL